MCLIEETGDSTHKQTGRGSWEAVNPSPLRLPNFKQLILSNANFYKSFHVSFRLFFSFKETFISLNLSRRGKASLIRLRTVNAESNSEQHLKSVPISLGEDGRLNSF